MVASQKYAVQIYLTILGDPIKNQFCVFSPDIIEGEVFTIPCRVWGGKSSRRVAAFRQLCSYHIVMGQGHAFPAFVCQFAIQGSCVGDAIIVRSIAIMKRCRSPHSAFRFCLHIYRSLHFRGSGSNVSIVKKPIVTKNVNHCIQILLFFLKIKADILLFLTLPGPCTMRQLLCSDSFFVPFSAWQRRAQFRSRP